MGNLSMIKYGLLVLGIAGSVLFFPFNFGNSGTCLAHKYIKSNMSICCESSPAKDRSDDCMGVETHTGENHHLLSHYLYPFAFLWWASIGLTVLQIRKFKFKNKLFKIRNQGSLK